MAPKGRLPRDRQKDMREQFCGLAADMEMGYYTDAEGHQWDARPFVIREIMPRLGYSVDTVLKGQHPSWWPGTDAMRRMVSLKVMLRQAEGRAGTGAHPWLDPLLAASVNEVLHRLYATPEEVGMRELIELTTKLVRIQNEQRRTGGMLAPGQVAVSDGIQIHQTVTETILSLPKEEQQRARHALEVITGRMREALPAEVAS